MTSTCRPIRQSHQPIIALLTTDDQVYTGCHNAYVYQLRSVIWMQASLKRRRTCNIALRLDPCIGDCLAIRHTEGFHNATCCYSTFKQPAKLQASAHSSNHSQHAARNSIDHDISSPLQFMHRPRTADAIEHSRGRERQSANRNNLMKAMLQESSAEAGTQISKLSTSVTSQIRLTLHVEPHRGDCIVSHKCWQKSQCEQCRGDARCILSIILGVAASYDSKTECSSCLTSCSPDSSVTHMVCDIMHGEVVSYIWLVTAISFHSLCICEP